MQKDSYKAFLQAEIAPTKRKPEGLQAAFISAFPIVSHNGYVEMKFLEFNIAKPPFDTRECQLRGLTYAAAVRAKLQMIIYDREAAAPKTVKEVKEQEVYMGEVPLMTDYGSFIVNGTERVIVSQLHRSPGVFFEHDKGKTHSSGKLLFSARIIPYRGSWLDFEFDPKDFLYFRVDRRRKMPVTILLKAIGLTPETILAHFFVFDTFQILDSGANMAFVPDRLRGEVARFDIVDKTGAVVVEKDKRITARHLRQLEQTGTTAITVPEDFLVARVVAHNVVDADTGEIVAKANDELTEALLKKLRLAGVKDIRCLFTNELDEGAYISQTLAMDETADELAARVAIYRMMRPGEPPTEDAVQALFQRLFYNPDTYDLSRVGRMKFNARVSRESPEGEMTLSNEDILDVVKILVELRNGRGEVDDIDHLGNRRVRCVGELAENQYRSGLARIEKAVKERLGQAETEALMPHDLINSQADQRSAEGVLRREPTVAVHGPDQPAERDHAQAACVGPGPGRSDARARRLRGARRAPDALRPRVPDRDAGRPEHRPDQLAGVVRAVERIRLPRDAVPPCRGWQGHRSDRLPLGDPGRQVRHCPGQRRSRRARQAGRRTGVGA